VNIGAKLTHAEHAADAVAGHLARTAPDGGDEPRDRTAVWEARLAEGGGTHNQNPVRMAQAIGAFRAEQAALPTEVPHALWGHWCEFDVVAHNTETVRVLSKPQWDGVPDQHHVEFWHPAITPTGYWSTCVVRSGAKGADLEAWAAAEAERVMTEHAATPRPKSAKRAKPKSAVEQLEDLGLLSKPDPAAPVLTIPTGPEPELPFSPAADSAGVPYYGWDIVYTDRRGKEQRCHYVGSEKKARGKAKLRAGFERLVSCQGLSREAYIRTFGKGGM
jgi:hypothetical protein